MGDRAVRLTEGGPSAWAMAEHSASQEDPYIRGISDDLADYLVSNWDFEHVAPEEAASTPTMSQVEAVMSGTLSELQESLETGTYDNNLDVLERYELAHKNRDGAYERIDQRRDE